MATRLTILNNVLRKLRETEATTVTDTSGVAVGHFEYLPYGELIPQATVGNTDAIKLAAFNGKELDGETGLQYFGARYYDPRFARWTRSTPPSGGRPACS